VGNRGMIPRPSRRNAETAPAGSRTIDYAAIDRREATALRNRMTTPSTEDILISVVVPVYQAEGTLRELIERLRRALTAITPHYEIVLVDDRSPDESWPVILDLAQRHPGIVAVRLSRNFGQHYAISAGLDMARGRWTVLMDCDLQDQPEHIGLLLKRAQDGFDIVLARRVARQDPLSKRLMSAGYHKVFALLSGYALDPSVGAFQIMDRKVVDAFRRMREAHRLVGGMIEWLGFSTAYVDVQHAARREGRSSYRFRTRMQVALDGAISFSNRPLYFSVLLGAAISLASGAWVTFIFVHFFFVSRTTPQGWPSLMAVTTFIGGLILFNLGVIGLYIGRVYDQVKQRPVYVVDQVVVGAGAPAVLP